MKKKTEIQVANELAKSQPRKVMLPMAQDVMVRREFSPIDQMIDIAQGKDLTKDHPLLGFIVIWHSAFSELIQHELAGDTLEEAISMLDDLLNKSQESLTDSWVAHELRAKMSVELASYLQAKPKEEASDKEKDPDKVDVTTPLSESEIADFMRVFENEYGGLVI